MGRHIQKAWGGLVVINLLILAILSAGCSEKKEEVKPSTAESTTKLAEASPEPKAGTTALDTVKPKSEDLVEEDSVEEDLAEEESIPTKSSEKKEGLHPVHMGMWGYCGGTGFMFDMDGTKGSYIPYDIAEAKEYGQRRQLQLVSYNPRNGRCIINAFLQGKYIGQFNGIFEEADVEDDNQESHYFQAYNGIFTSVKGSKLDFHFHFD